MKARISLIYMLWIFSFGGILSSHFYAQSYEFYTVERFVISGIGTVPLFLLGGINLFKPDWGKIALDALNGKDNLLKSIKIGGFSLCLSAIVILYNAYKVYSMGF